MSKPDRYYLLHRHDHGVSFYGIDYTPTKKKPYPDIRKLVDLLHIDFEPAKDEELELRQMDPHEIHAFDASQAGSRGVENPCNVYYDDLEEADDPSL